MAQARRGGALLAILALVGIATVAVWMLGSGERPAREPQQNASGTAAPDDEMAAVDVTDEPGSTEGTEPRRSVATTDARPETADTRGEDHLWGLVVAADDRSPIAGAKVELQHRPADEFWNLDLDYGARIDGLAETTTDADGRFAFDVRPGRHHRLVVTAAGYAPTIAVDRRGGAEVVVALTRGAGVEGVVRCAGEPLADVPIRVAVVGESVELAAGRTGLDGTFRFDRLQEAQVFVQMLSPRHEQVWKRVELRAGRTAHVEIDVPKGQTLRGIVVDAATGAPIAGARISDSWTFRRFATSGQDGRFELGGLDPTGHVEIDVRATGYAPASRTVSGRLDEEARFELAVGGTVFGRVTGEGGAALRDVYVAIGASFEAGPGVRSSDWIRATVESDGAFAAGGLRPHLGYWLYARAAGQGTRVYRLPAPIGDGERRDVGEIRLAPGGSVAGRVVNERGEPLVGISVSLEGQNADALALAPEVDGGHERPMTQFRSRSAPTDANGAFRFADVAGGAYAVIARRSGDPRPARREVELVDGGTVDDIALVLTQGAQITGRFRRADGQALDAGLTGAMHVSAWAPRHPSVHAAVSTDGTFELTGLESGVEYALSLLFAPPGFTMAPLRGVAAGSEDVQVLLEAAARIAGRVVDADGNGVAGHVFVLPEDTYTSGAVPVPTEPDGTFEIEVPPAFVGTAHASRLDGEGPNGKTPGVRAGQTDVLIRLP